MRCSIKPAWHASAALLSVRTGKGYLRFSVANSYENLMSAVERIREFLNTTVLAKVAHSKTKNPTRQVPDRVS